MAGDKEVKLALIVGSTREDRFADVVVPWLAQEVRSRHEFRLEVLDLLDYPLPFFGQRDPRLDAAGPSAVAAEWRAQIAAADAFVMTAAEYNHAPTAVLKNALDWAREEWARKPVAFVGYGGVGGARAVEHLRMVAVELRMAPVRDAVHIGGEAFFAAREGRPLESFRHLRPECSAMLDDLAWWARALKTTRQVADTASSVGYEAAGGPAHADMPGTP